MTNLRPEVTGRKTGAAPVFAPLALRICEACAALGVSRSHLYSMASKGDVQLVRLGGRTLVTMAEINRLLSGGAK